MSYNVVHQLSHNNNNNDSISLNYTLISFFAQSDTSDTAGASFVSLLLVFNFTANYLGCCTTLQSSGESTEWENQPKSQWSRSSAGPQLTVSPVQRILDKALLPHHGGHSTGHEVGVVLGPVANQMAEPQLPSLRNNKGQS